ncbi:RNA ligase [Coniophora puteana RWD-64-598 SS2]|uniref:tRNA ligase n=1 Tax=Coniophora puteana (strain RWD-64-598) TaxID=741705 RepID=R7SE70_CONPW|nr:RNA ligase [Coniophora puteana RWD-64-598 SS2]EIW74468.1 RNA ligase [Coniophora puteana RWD-64-598 SS2]
MSDNTLTSTTSTDNTAVRRVSASAAKKDHELVESLMRISKKNPRLIRSTEYVAPNDPDVTLRSWKMNEFKYYDVPSPFPTLARGLFSRDTRTGDGVWHEIVARGYDKFFNIGEVPWTSWQSLEAHTEPPYTLSLKSNGCIIFIAPLSPTKLVVTSKHAIGPQGTAETHSQVGERWLRKHLEKKGKATEQLAKTLWEKKWTAVAELCDDSFEEHVLPYPPEKSGLHLHGINESTANFRTMPSSVVDAFADEWGFIKTATIQLDSIAAVNSFTDEVGMTGQWNGEPLEGFVVRTHVRAPPKAVDARDRGAAPPYGEGASFFFKVKFDEPYMMYRDWREITKALLAAKNGTGGKEAKLPKNKMKRPETKLYVEWCRQEIRRDPTAFAEYGKGKGIIATRERFLRWMESQQGKEGLVTLPQEENKAAEGYGKTVIVPVAIPGCGKTAVAVGLVHLFGFGHVQSDDIRAKKPAPIFIRRVMESLNLHDVVIADKNNHLRQHRTELRTACSARSPPVRLLGLQWALDAPPATLHRVCGDRVLARGENHQSLRPNPENVTLHEDVIWQFIRGREELGEGELDECIDMELEEDLESALRRAVDGVVQLLDLERPSEEKMREALEAVRGYVAGEKRQEPAKSKEKGKKKKEEGVESARYFGILPELSLASLLDPLFTSPDAPVEGTKMWEQIKQHKQVANRPHITFVHRLTRANEEKLWDACVRVASLQTPPTFWVRLGSVLWNGRVMGITVEEMGVVEENKGEAPATTSTTADHAQDEEAPDAHLQTVSGPTRPGREGRRFLDGLEPEVLKRLHITAGTHEHGVKPIECMSMTVDWRNGRRKEIGEFELKGPDGKGVVVEGRVKGLNF